MCSLVLRCVLPAVVPFATALLALAACSYCYRTAWNSTSILQLLP